MIESTILNALKLFHRPSEVVELRVIDAGYQGNLTGCFNDFNLMAKEAARLDGHAPAIYFTLNECNPLVIARAPNKVIKSKQTTSDSDIIRRRWFPIDADAIRPSGVSAPDGLHEQALCVADDVSEWLSSQGWPEPIKGDSGNGGHLCYALDLPNDKTITELIKNVTEVIAGKFNTETIDIDKKVFNAARIWKLYGTLAGKGENIPGQPHRRSKIISVPSRVEVVTLEMLKKISGSPKPGIAKPQSAKPMVDIDVETKCSEWGLNIIRNSAWNDGTKYVLVCPFDANHKDTVIIKHGSGAVSFTCPHNSCSGKTWKDLRTFFEGEREKKHQPAHTQENLWEGFSEGGNGEEIPKPRIFERINPKADLEKMRSSVAMQASGERVTLDLPWRKFTERSGGLRPGTVWILAGPVKSGKSYLAMNIIAHMEAGGHTWKYLPLEDTRNDWMFRMLAIQYDDYVYTDDKQETAHIREEALTNNHQLLLPYFLRVSENPRTGIIDANGKTIVPPIDYHMVLEWAENAVKDSRLVVIDPFAQIDFTARDQYRQHQEFTRELLGMVSGKNSTILMLAHLGKRGGEKSLIPMTADDVQGAADITRLVQTTILLDRHDPKESEIHRMGGMHCTEGHNRTVIIAAVRTGSGQGQRIALDAGKGGPRFDEKGVIDMAETQKKQKGKKK